METKNCSTCKIEKSIDCFTRTKACCKQCRVDNSKDIRDEKRLAEREIKRKEFFKIIAQRCKDEGVEFDHRHVFLNEEILALMRLKPECYDFCDVPEQIADEVRKTQDYIDGYILKHIFVSDKIRNTAYTRIIV